MSCNLTSGRTRVCRNRVGGITKVFIGNGGDFVSGIAYDEYWVSALPTATVYEFDLESQNGHGSHTIEPQISADNHTVFQQVSVMMMLPVISGEWNQILTTLEQSNSLFVFVQDNNGNVYMVEDAKVVSNPSGTGQQMGDFNGYTVTMQANMKYKPYVLIGSSSAFAAYEDITVVQGETPS